MTQVLFASATLPLETDLDANFTQLYGRTALLTGGTNSVGVGVTPNTWGTLTAVEGNGGALAFNPSTAYVIQNLYFNGTNWIYKATGLASVISLTGGQVQFFTTVSGTAGGTATLVATATIDAAGNFLVGQTTSGPINANATSMGSGGLTLSHASGTASGAGYMSFAYNATSIGSVTQSGTTGVAYNTSSDYRLKSGVAPISASAAFIDALKPCTWTWISDGSAGAGFIAHELQAVSPMSVAGVKDAVDEHGKPIYQAVEYGSAEVIAMLVAELQAVRARLHILDGH